MIDDFVKNAFSQAHNALVEEEYKAYERKVIKNDGGDTMLMAAILSTGVERIEALLKALCPANQDTLAIYINNILLTAFHEGYTARIEDEQ